jgi:hypothetical protein
MKLKTWIAIGVTSLALGVGAAYAVQQGAQAPADDHTTKDDESGSKPARDPHVWEVRLQPDVPEGYEGRPGAHRTPMRQDLTRVRLERLEDGRHALRLEGEGETTAGLESLDRAPGWTTRCGSSRSPTPTATA